jgi:hypothetical protein
LPQDKLILLNTGSFGDVYINLALLNSFVDFHDENIQVIVEAKYSPLTNRFHNDRIFYSTIQSVGRLHALIELSNRRHLLEKGRIFPLLPTMHPFIAEASLSQRMTIFESSRLLMGLPYGSPLHWGNFETVRFEFEAFIEKTGITQGDSIIISPVTQSNTPVSTADLEAIVRAANENNLRPFINVAGNNKGDTFTGNTISIPPHFAVELHDYAGYFVTALSGLSLALHSQPNQARGYVICYKANMNCNFGDQSFAQATHYIRDHSNPDLINRERIEEVVVNSGFEEVDWKIKLKKLVA